MRAIDIIAKKRDHLELTTKEIEFFVDGYTQGDIPDYQAAAWAMAVLLNGMTARETKDLTMAMVKSGETIDLTDVTPLAVDKHSTGGVGDKTTLVVEPAVAACGLSVGKMSGRGLGYSGGTLDKLESIPGFRTDLSKKEFLDQLAKLGLVLSGQTGDLAPADGKFYALRDVTATVPSIPLIASSIMSKKIAAGAGAIVLDVKVGRGAFMENEKEARALSELMVSIAKLANRKAVALLADMNQPLGHAVGNALEVKEAIDTLQNQGPRDFLAHCLEVAGFMLSLGGLAANKSEGHELALSAIRDGRAWEKFRLLVKTQGGNVKFIDQPELFPSAAFVETVYAPRSGFLSRIDARIIGETAVLLGAGRTRKEDAIDHAVGVVVNHKVGDYVEAGQPLFTMHINQKELIEGARQAVLSAYHWSQSPVEALPQFYGVIH